MLRPLARACFVALLASAAVPAFAQPGGAQPVDLEAPLTVEVALVRASRAAAAVDPALAGFAKDLSALPFTSFQRVEARSWATRPGGAGQADLGDVHVEVTVTEATATAVTATVVATRAGKPVARTSFSRPWGRAHVVTVGAEGAATLLLPVRVVR